MNKPSDRKRRKVPHGEKNKDAVYLDNRTVQDLREGLRSKWYLFLALIMIAMMISYSNCLTNQFVFDDIHLIAANFPIRGIQKIPQLLSIGGRKIAYRPIRMISYAVDYTLNKTVWGSAGGYKGSDKGLNPLGYHISNIVYHMVTSLLVFLLVLRLTANYCMAFLTAALFMLHPVQTDSVTYLSGRRDILVTLFYLAGFYFFLRYRQTNRKVFILAFFLSYLLSLGSKEMGVTLPAVCLAYDLVTHFQTNTSPRMITCCKELFHAFKKVFIQYKYLYSVIVFGSLFFAYYTVFIKSPSTRSSYYGDSLVTTLLTVGKILVHYMKLLLFPVNLNADYSYNAFPLSVSFLEPATFFSFVMLGLVGYGTLRLLIVHRVAAFGLIWLFITLLPVCQIFPHHELLAEHYLYLPSFGFCLLMAYVYNSFIERGKYTYLLYVSFAVLMCLFSLRIMERNKDWKDGLTLWQKTVSTVPLCARARNNLGYEYDIRGRLNEAIVEYQEALAIKPHFADPYSNLGFIYYTRGEVDRAMLLYKKALELNPRLAVAHNNLGVAYLGNGALRDAWIEFAAAIKINRFFAEAHMGLGVTLAKQGGFNMAIFHFMKALALKPDLAEAHINLAATYYSAGNYRLAIEHCEKARQLGAHVSPQLLERLKPYY